MNENEKILEDFQKPFEEKLAEAKAKSGVQNLPDNESFDEEKKEKENETSSVVPD